MHTLGAFLPAAYEIAGFTLAVQKERGASPVFCPHVMEAFSSSNQVGQADFVLTIKSACPAEPFEVGKQLVAAPDRVTMHYGSETEYVRLESDPDLKRWELYTTNTNNHIDQWFYKVGNLFAWAVPGQGAFVLHGVLLEWQGKGIILTAASGTGKTTHARLWREHEDALIINGDRVLLRKENGRWYGCGTPWSGSSGECVNRKVPLDAIVFLARGEENQAQRTSVLNAMGAMLPRIIAPEWHSEYSVTAMDLALNCLEETPLFALRCLPDADSVKVLKETLLAEL